MLKLSISLLLVIMLLWAPSAFAISFTFSGATDGGTASAIMDISYFPDRIVATVDNTSPLILNDGTGTNSPALTGFGFSTTPNDVTVTRWSLEDRNETNISSLWSLQTNYDPNSGLNIFLDFYADTNNGSQGGLYNPYVTSGFGGPPRYFTRATLTLFADIGNQTLSFSDGYARFQNVGLDGEGSLKTVSVPEPGTMLMLGFVLLGLVGVSRKRFNNRN